MSLKELTLDRHQAAENTQFMKAVFAKTLSLDLWADWTYQKTLFYLTIENSAGALGLLHDVPSIRRSFYIYQDFSEMWGHRPLPAYRKETVDYHNYLLSISKDPDLIAAHLYVWHMGDLYGGQMIKKIVEAPHRSLDFTDHKKTVDAIRLKINDSMADEANRAFDWAIRIMNSYEQELKQ